MRKIAVLGLGRFGMRLAKDLAANGAEVIAVDRNASLVDEVKDRVTVAVQLDTTDEAAMRAQDIGSVDVCVVAIGEGFEASMLTTLVSKKLGAKEVIARAQTNIQADILRRIGADKVLLPETEAARELARRLINPQIQDFVELDEQHGIVQLKAPQSFYGKTLAQLRLRNRFHVNLVTIMRGTDETGKTERRRRTIAVPQESDVIEEGDILVLIGEHAALVNLPEE